MAEGAGQGPETQKGRANGPTLPVKVRTLERADLSP